MANGWRGRPDVGWLVALLTRQPSPRYLGPAAQGHDFTSALYSLTGMPAVPPRHALGFMATYWGYDSMQEVEGNMTRFRAEGYPIDSFIMVRSAVSLSWALAPVAAVSCAAAPPLPSPVFPARSANA